MEKTLSIIKPNAVADNNIGEILSRFEREGLRIAAMKMVQLSRSEAEGFYEEHRGRPFFDSLVAFMTSGPVVLLALEGEQAVARNREIMGATNPEEAAEGTLRKLFARSLQENAVHGSDAPASAARELAYFFAATEICDRQ